jgi:hypothetical protein
MPGSGLGLAIVHQVVTDHGGTVEVLAAPDGDGTLMRVVLPLRQPAEPRDDEAGDDHGERAADGAVPDALPRELFDDMTTASPHEKHEQPVFDNVAGAAES